MKKHLLAGKTDGGRVFVSVEFRDGRLSISGVEGPLGNGDCRGSCGQCIDAAAVAEDCPGSLTGDQRKLLVDVWRRWHLNDMRAGCEHQRRDNWGRDEIEVVTYGLTSEAHRLRRAAQEEAEAAALEGRVADLSPAGKFLIGPDWLRDRHSPPDADSPLSGLFEVRKRETKATGWVRQSEHPLGVLSKPCPECGYKYGTAWLKEDVPGDVIEFLESLPETDSMPQVWK